MKTLILKAWPDRAALGRWSALLLMATGMQAWILLPLQAATTKKEITNTGITRAVEDGLLFEKGVFPNDVDVSTSQGIVTLAGTSENLLTKERAVKVAGSVRGVRGVIDRITVTPPPRPDADIRKDILSALLQDPATESYQVNVSVQDAVASVTGSVGSHAEQQLAARIAEGVKGLKEVRNDITVNYLAKRTDAEIAADIKATLQWDIWINGELIQAAVKDGKVTLTGIVGSVLGKAQAYEDAWVNGVLSVDDSAVKIDPAARDNVRRKLHYTESISDGDIMQAILVALRLDPRVAAFAPEVTVEAGVVRLGGAVGNLKAKTAAEQDAKNIIGVWRVDNLLKVRPVKRPADAEMEQHLKAALVWDPLLDSSRIHATVIHRVAYLSGMVDSDLQKADAQDVAARTKGVVLVHNYLKIEPEFSSHYYEWPRDNPTPYYAAEIYGPQQTWLSDEQIKKNIEDAFFWSPFVDRDDIKVTVHGGVATLTGTVGNWIGYGEADRDAHKSGATTVVNRITVKKGAWL